MSAAVPARVGSNMIVGYSRVGIQSQNYENMFTSIKGAYRSFTRRRRTLLNRHLTTGWFNVEWIESTITGILVEQGGSMPAFASGVMMRQDAVLLCLDGLAQLDQIYDSEVNTFFEVQQIEEHRNPSIGGFAFRVCHLHRLELFRKG